MFESLLFKQYPPVINSALLELPLPSEIIDSNVVIIVVVCGIPHLGDVQLRCGNRIAEGAEVIVKGPSQHLYAPSRQNIR